MRTAAALVVLSFCLVLPAWADVPSVARAEIVWAGLYEAEVTGAVIQPDTAMGQTNELANTRKIKAATTIEGRLGVSFGLEYALVGSPTGSNVAITIVVVLPKTGLRNPSRSGRTYREQWRPAPKPIGGRSIVGYTFDHEWEVVPGLWTFEIWSGDDKVGEQSFCVVADQPADETGPREPCRSVPSV